MNPPRWYLSFVISVCEAADLEWTHTLTVLLCAPRVNERQKMRHYRARSAEERRRRKNAKSRFFTSRGAYINLRYITIIYTHSIANQLYNTVVVFKMRDSVYT